MSNHAIGELLSSLRRLRLVEPTRAQQGTTYRALNTLPADERVAVDPRVQHGARAHALGVEEQKRARVLSMANRPTVQTGIGSNDLAGEANAVRDAQQRAAEAVGENPPQDYLDTFVYEDSLSTYRDLVALADRMAERGGGSLEGYLAQANGRANDHDLLARSVETTLQTTFPSSGDALLLDAARALRDHSSLELQAARAKMRLLMMGFHFLQGDGRVDDLERSNLDDQTRAIFQLDARVSAAEGRVQALRVASEDPTLRGNVFAPDAARLLIDRRQAERVRQEAGVTAVDEEDVGFGRGFDDDEDVRLEDRRALGLVQTDADEDVDDAERLDAIRADDADEASRLSRQRRADDLAEDERARILRDTSRRRH